MKPASADRVLASAGRPLDTALQQDMGQRFDHDFSQVRVNSGVSPKHTHITASPLRASLASQAAEAVREAGTPLPVEIQHEATLRYGQSFSDVRLHTDERASAAAASMHASAFTLGNDIAFGTNRYAPGSPQGQLLLQHELRHVAQQRSATRTSSLDIDSTHSQHEHEARQILDPHVETLSVQRIQCAPEDAQYSLGDGLVDTAGQTAFGARSWPFIKAVLEGFAGGMQADVKVGRADASKSYLAKLLVPWNAAKFYVGYLVGLVLGLISPITDLVKGVIGIFKLGISALEWLARWSPVGVAISQKRQQKIALLMQKFNDLTIELGKSFMDFISDPRATIQKFSGFLDNLMKMALGEAREIGAKGAHAIFDFLEREYLEMGKGIGEVIGTLIAQVLLLVFSEAIGNLISKGASFLGKAAEFVAGKAVEVFNWVKGIFSKVLGLLRNAVKGALKLFEGLFNKAVEAFDALLGLFRETASLDVAGEKVAAGVGRGVTGTLPNTMESRMVTSARTSPAKVSDLTSPKVHPSNLAQSQEAGATRAMTKKEVMGPQSTNDAIEDLNRTAGAAPAREAATIGTEVELMEVQDWAAELSGKGFDTFPRNSFGKAKIGDHRLSSFFTDQRARPDMIAINESKKTIIVGDVTGNPGARAAIPGHIGQEEGLHIEKTIEYAKQLKRQLPKDADYKVFAQDRHWQTGSKTKLIEIR